MYEHSIHETTLDRLSPLHVELELGRAVSGVVDHVSLLRGGLHGTDG